jgi:hypothetical protein
MLDMPMPNKKILTYQNDLQAYPPPAQCRICYENSFAMLMLRNKYRDEIKLLEI